MTPDSWRTAAEPRRMLDHVKDTLSERRLRLLGCAFARMVWPHMIDDSSRLAVEAAERYADGLISREEMAAAEAAAFETARLADLRSTVSDPGWAATRTAARAANLHAWSSATGAQFVALLAAAPWEFGNQGKSVIHHGDQRVRAEAKLTQCELVREVVGDPFAPKAVRSNWLRWNDGVIGEMARAIYEERRFDEMGVLADALEEAGCADEDILGHCRRTSSCGHVRGCWVIDLLRGVV